MERKINNYCFACGEEIPEDIIVCPNCGYSFTTGDDLDDIVEYDGNKIIKKDNIKKDRSSFWTQLSEELGC